MFYAIPNLSSQTAEPVRPWEREARVPSDVQGNKNAFIQWCSEPDTRHCLYSSFEGLTPSIRVGADNPPVYMHGIVVDYDTVVDTGMVSTIPARNRFDYAPNFFCHTFSGGARLVWEFEEPLLLGPLALTKAFLKQVKKHMKLSRLLPGLDEETLFDPHKYYELGRDWQRLGSERIPAALVHHWMYLAGNSIKAFDVDKSPIPMSAVVAEVERRFPGKWPGSFELGARGPRFWDASADNDRAAVVREGGMQCFTGDTAFVTWKALFGSSFVEQYESMQIGNLVKDSFFDGRNYWRIESNGGLTMLAKDDFRLNLRVKGNLSSAIRKGEPVSEVDKVIHFVQENARIDGVMPFVHREAGVVQYQGKRYLNSSTVKCLEPSPKKDVQWGRGFEWLASFFDGLFDPPEQLDFFLGWLKWFYENAYNLTPSKGQAIFISGEPNQGKTLLSTGIISRMVGGHQDASQYLLGETGPYTDHIVSSPLLTVDDSAPARDSKCHAKFSASIKQLVANADITHLRKYHDARQVSWYGRIVVTCNTDPESLRILPSVEINNLDKLSFFKFSSRTCQFPQDLDGALVRELPVFCRWLLEWEMPEQVVGDRRFGTAEYHHPTLLQLARTGENSYAFQELLDMFRDTLFLAGTNYWHGNTAQLLATLSVLPEHEILARQFSDPRKLGRILSKLAAQEGSGVILDNTDKTGRTWLINCDRGVVQRKAAVQRGPTSR